MLIYFLDLTAILSRPSERLIGSMVCINWLGLSRSGCYFFIPGGERSVVDRDVKFGVQIESDWPQMGKSGAF